MIRKLILGTASVLALGIAGAALDFSADADDVAHEQLEPSHHWLNAANLSKDARPRAAPPQPMCDNRPEFQHPGARRLVRDIEPALGEKLLHITVAQGET